jgi:hypothetical protein
VAADWARQFILIDRLARDPFQVEMTWFPLNPDRRQGGTTHALLPEAGRTDALTAHIRQWATDVSREHRARASEMAAVQAEAASLKLSITMVGENSLAVINGEPLKVGQRVNGFSIVRIEADRVVVSKNGVAAVLTLDR